MDGNIHPMPLLFLWLMLNGFYPFVSLFNKQVCLYKFAAIL